MLQKSVVESLLASLIHDSSDPVAKGDIIVLTPYRAHRRLLARTIANSGFNLTGVRVRTVAAFQVVDISLNRCCQGCEARVVIVSVGSWRLHSPFLSEQLVNVMLSRQQCELFVVTNLHVSGSTWNTAVVQEVQGPLKKAVECFRALPTQLRYHHLNYNVEVSATEIHDAAATWMAEIPEAFNYVRLEHWMEPCNPYSNGRHICAHSLHNFNGTQKYEWIMVTGVREVPFPQGRTPKGPAQSPFPHSSSSEDNILHMTRGFADSLEKLEVLIDGVSFIPTFHQGVICEAPYAAVCNEEEAWILPVTTSWIRLVCKQVLAPGGGPSHNVTRRVRATPLPGFDKPPYITAFNTNQVSSHIL